MDQKSAEAYRVFFRGMKVASGMFGYVLFPQHLPKVVYKYTQTANAISEREAFAALKGCAHVIPMLEPPITLIMTQMFLDTTRFTLLRAQSDLLKLVQASLLTPHQKERMYPQLFEALTELHKHKVAHLDLKMENILVVDVSSAAPHLYVADFGLSFVGVEHGEVFCGRVRGSRAYACPEMMEGLPWNPYAADVFSMGVVLHGLAFGHFPFNAAQADDPLYAKYRRNQTKGMRPTEALAAQWTSLRDKLQHASSELKQMLNDCLTVDPHQRRRFY